MNILSIKKIFLFLLLFFSLVLISKTHEDFSTYHIQAINHIFYDKLFFGVANANANEIQVSLLSYVQVLYFLPFFESKLIHLPVFFIFISTIGYFYQVIINKTSENTEVFFSLFVFFILLIKFKRLSEFGYDYIAQFIILLSFHKIFFLAKSTDETLKSLLFFIFSIVSKFSALFSFPLFLFILNIKKLKNITSRYIFIILLIGGIIMFNSFSRTGCLFYPINTTCFERNIVSWSAKEIVNSQLGVISSWAKGFYGQNKSKYKIIPEEKSYLSNFNWVKVWIDLHFFYKVFEYLIIVMLAYALNFIIFKKKIILFKIKKNNLIYTFLACLSVMIWFFSAPQFRFGFSGITILLFFIINMVISSNFVFVKKRLLYLLIFSIIFFNLSNFKRIYNEFNRNDIYEFKSFPWINEDILKKRNIYNAEEKKFFLIYEKFKIK